MSCGNVLYDMWHAARTFLDVLPTFVFCSRGVKWKTAVSVSVSRWPQTVTMAAVTCDDCASSLFWLFCVVSSPSLDPEGRRPPLRGHEKSIGRLSQHTALACGLLKGQIPKPLPFILFFVIVCMSLLFILSRKQATAAYTCRNRKAVSGCWYFPHLIDWCSNTWLQVVIEISCGQ